MMLWAIAAMAVVIVVVIAVVILLAAVGTAGRRARGGSGPQREAEARVVDKRSQITGGGESRADQLYFATFQFPDGNRIELRVPVSEAGLLVVGDEGRLSWRGSDYVGFAREIMR